VPQAGCRCPRCAVALQDSRRRLRVSCLGLLSATGHTYLVDATPDLPAQVADLPAFPSALLLTHAHYGHYAGLLHLGREAGNTRGVPVLTTARMANFLRSSPPWEQLVRLGNIELQEVQAGSPVTLAPDLTVEPIAVPHRGEYSDTLAFRVAGPSRSLLYLPDVDAWSDAITREVERVDVALVDGTFFGRQETPFRDPAEIPHPPIEETLASLRGTTAVGRIRFLHLNHTNPVVEPGSRQRRIIQEAGARVAREGDWIPL